MECAVVADLIVMRGKKDGGGDRVEGEEGLDGSWGHGWETWEVVKVLLHISGTEAIGMRVGVAFLRWCG